MPISKQQMATDIAKVPEFTWGAGTVNVSYAPSGMTEDTIANMEVINDPKALSVAENTHAMNAALIALVVDWDVYEDEAMTIKTPLDEEHLRKLNVFFRAEVLKRVFEAFIPNATGATQSESAPSSSIRTESATVPPSDASSS